MWSRNSKYSGRTPPKTPPLTTNAIRNIFLGQQDFGKATVNCLFLHKKSKWGTLESTPIAILRLLLTFKESLGYKLSGAEVELSFVPVDIGVEPPSVTEHVYPLMIHGPPTTRVRNTSREIRPHLEAFGVAAGGLGASMDAQSTQTAQWTFETVVKSDKDQLGTIVSWLWESNALNPYKELVPPRNVAVVIEHSKCKFQMNLKIDARLRNESKHLFWLLRSRPKNRTIADFSGQGDVDLEPVVKGLKDEIHRLNALSIRGEYIIKHKIFTSKQAASAYIALEKTLS
ncbi:hypothetical protein MMC29_004055 [Sticta canariensis]|nr:hypothetical protein [Sticta canariensis]